MLILVDFPAPLGPSNPNTSPLSTASVSYLTATFAGFPSIAGKTFYKLFITIAVSSNCSGVSASTLSLSR